MPTDIRALVDKLLPHIDQAPVINALICHTRSEPGYTLQLGTAPSLPVALEQAKRGVGHAAAIAQVATDHELLDKLARMPQKTVRRIVAANIHTSEDTLRFLADWALTEQAETATQTELFATLDLRYWLRATAHLFSYRDATWDPQGSTQPTSLPTDRIVDQLIRRADPGLCRDLFRSDIVPLQAAMVAAAAHGLLPLSFTELFDHAPVPAQIAAFTALVPLRGHLTDEAAYVFTDYVASRPAEDLPVKLRNGLTVGVKLSAYTLERFIGSGNPLLTFAAVRAIVEGRTSISDTLLAELCLLSSPDSAGELLRSPAITRRLTPAQIHSLSETASAPGAAIRTLLTERGGELPEATVTNLIRCADSEVLGDWLACRLPVTPSHAQLTELVSNPAGNRAEMPPWVIASRPVSMTLFLELVNRKVQFDTQIDRTGLAVVLEHSAAALFELVAKSRQKVLSGYLAKRLVDRFGDRADAWDALAQFAPTVTAGTLEELFTVIDMTLTPAA